MAAASPTASKASKTSRGSAKKTDSAKKPHAARTATRRFSFDAEGRSDKERRAEKKALQFPPKKAAPVPKTPEKAKPAPAEKPLAKDKVASPKTTAKKIAKVAHKPTGAARSVRATKKVDYALLSGKHGLIISGEDEDDVPSGGKKRPRAESSDQPAVVVKKTKVTNPHASAKPRAEKVDATPVSRGKASKKELMAMTVVEVMALLSIHAPGVSAKDCMDKEEIVELLLRHRK